VKYSIRKGKNEMNELVEGLVDLYKQWNIGPITTMPSHPVLPKRKFDRHPERNYALKNKQNRKYLQHEHQTYGINLGWTDDATDETGLRVSRWFFIRNGDSSEPIKYGETIALGNGQQPSYVNFKKRMWGVNLAFEESPSFDWKILGGKPGTPVKTREWVALYNTKSEKGECLVYFNRNAGVDIGWPSSKRWGKLILEELKEEIEDLTEEAWETAKKEAIKALIVAAAG
jgi:hypothetical protein